jgi:RNAse (barnase) inhibitor barstar
MDIYVFDGKEFTSEKRMHEIFKEKMDFPDFYGMNFNAFWDSFTETLINEKGKIIINNFSDLKRNIGEENTKILIKLIKEAISMYGKFTLEIND